MDVEEMVERINAIAESRMEYETQHKDSGDNYACMVPESWCSKHETRLIDYMAKRGIDWQGLEIDAIADCVLDQFRMTPSHLWAAGNGGFTIESFAVGEVEMQIDCDTIETAWNPKLCETLSRQSDVVLRYHGESMALGYQSTDSVWTAEISAGTLRAIVKDLRALTCGAP